MLLQQIVKKLDGELDRLRSLRNVVAGLSKKPALRVDLPLLAEQSLAKIANLVPVKAEVDTPAKAQARPVRGRPRKPPADEPRVAEAPPRVSRRSRQAEPSALGKAASAGPVVISAAALVREREARLAVKAASPHQQTRQPEPEIRPEAFARELSARWLSSAGKA